MSYHIISYHIISYHTISFIIIYHVNQKGIDPLSLDMFAKEGIFALWETKAPPYDTHAMQCDATMARRDRCQYTSTWYIICMPYHLIAYRAISCCCHAIPYRTMPCYAITCRPRPWHDTPCHAAPYRIIPYNTLRMPSFTTPYHTISYRTVPYHTILPYILYDITSHRTT